MTPADRLLQAHKARARSLRQLYDAVLRAREAGLSLADIGKALGISRSGAQQLVKRAMRQYPTPA
jgi:DNA-directed RNA polymerase specialized sigma24 family protein